MQFGQQICLLTHDDIVKYLDGLDAYTDSMFGDLEEVLTEDYLLDSTGEIVGVLLGSYVDVLLDFVGDEHAIKEMIIFSFSQG